MKAKGSYQFEELEGRHAEAALLAERAQLRLDGFIDLVRRHGCPNQGKILEIGAAQGVRTRLMAEQFPDTEVVGVDRSSELLSVARERNQDLKNLSFKLADLYDLPFEDGHFDFVYVRLVFMHLADPDRAMGQLRRVLRSGGRLLVEDADRDCMFFEPAPSSFADFWEKVQEGQRRLGGDPNVGRRLAPLFKSGGFQRIQIETQPIVGEGREIEFLARALMPSLNVYLEPRDRSAGEAAIRDLIHLSTDPRATFYHFWFAVSGERE